MGNDYKYVRITGEADRRGVWPCEMAYWDWETWGWRFKGTNFALSGNGNPPAIGHIYAAVGTVPVVICPTPQAVLYFAGPNDAPARGQDDLPVRSEEIR